MATLGTPTNENGKGYQRWYPQVGDIRPEGCEYMSNPGNWVQAEFKNGERIEEYHVRNEQYRIPSQYTPPAGWYCVPDEDVAIDGDVYSEDMRPVWLNVGESVKSARSRAMPDGGWVLRREPVAFPETTARNVATALDPGLVNAINEHLEQPCQSESESAESVTEKADSTSVCRDTTGPESGTGASSATAPVAWQFRKQPMKQIVDHYRLLAADEIVSSDCLWWSSATCQWLTFGEACHGQPLPDIQAPACRPVYAPLPTRLEDVPDGRVFQVNMERYWKHSLGYGFWGSNGEVDPDVALPVSPITITDYVAELKAVE
jgi:hypothetical protein